ncbi:hypothetical protein ACFXAF_28830 [Kitasatospora sp. NPDC059463]|uniref:hypothetical protein n=1 Tax=unclassified Kitasatospora TaxID=2633591 RepID=UPI0036BB7916
MTADGPFSAHERLPDYLEALRDPDRIPLLGTAADRLGELRDLSPGRPAGAPPAPAGGVLVLVPPGSAAAPVGAALAARVGGAFVAGPPGAVSAVAGAPEHVVLAALADELSLELVLETLDATAALRRAGRGTAALGVLLGRDLDELSWLVAKGLGCALREPPARSQLCIAPWGGREPAEPSGTRWVVGEDVRAGVVAPLLAERHRLVSFATAGREHALVLRDTVVCGAGTGPAGPVPPAGAPGCAFSGQCFRAGVSAADVIPARGIRADAVLANSCMAWRPGHGLVAADYQLTNAFLGGIAAAFIGAVHQMVPDVRLNRLAHRAAAAGATVGQLGVLLNRQAAGREVPHHLLLGLPWVAPFPEAGPVGLDRLLPLLAEPEQDGGDGGDGVRARLRQAGRAVRGLRDLPLTGFLPAAGVDELDARLGAVVAGFRRGTASGAEGAADGAPVEELLALVADAEFDVALDLFDFAQVSESPPNEVWEDILETTAVPGGGPCPYCGGPTAVVTGRHPAHPRIEREVLACHRCGPVLDLPAGSPIRMITIDCPAVWPRPGTVDVELVITTAPGAEIRTAVALVQAARAGAHGLTGPEPQRLRLRPGGPTRLRAGIEVAEHAFAHHEHMLRGFVVADGQVHCAARPVAVRPRE